MDRCIAIVTGFSDDIASAAPGIEETSEVFLVTEKTSQNARLPKVDLAVYVFSPDTLYSSQLMSWFTWIHDHILPRQEYILSIKGADLSKGSFDALKGVPRVSTEELLRILRPERPGD
jgi:hypothetical protein